MFWTENIFPRESIFPKIRRFIFTLIVGFIGGVLIAPAKHLVLGEILFFVVLGFVFLLVYLYLDKKPRFYFFIGAVLIGLGIGLVRFQSYVKTDSTLAQYIGQNIKIEGVVVDIPDQRDSNTRLTVRLFSNNEKILAISSPYQNINYGDYVMVEGRLDTPQNFETDAGREFDYISYLKVRGIVYQIPMAQIRVIETGHGYLIYEKLFQIKKVFLQKINEVIPEPQVSLLAGLLVGEKRGLGDQINTQFRRTGLSHVVVLSGYNMTIVAESIMIFLSYFLPFYYTLFFGAGGVILFAMMVGGGATVVRASIMALIAIWARATGQVYSATAGLFLAGGVMILINPLVLAYDIGFQLSFLATLGLIYLAPPIEARLNFVSDKLGLRAIVATTFSAQIAVLPWIIYKIGELSIVALPANILVLPVVPLVMFIGFITVVFGFISVYPSLIFSYITYLLLNYVLFVVKFFSQFSLATIKVPEISLAVAVGLYLLIIFIYKYFTSVKSGENNLKPF